MQKNKVKTWTSSERALLSGTFAILGIFAMHFYLEVKDTAQLTQASVSSAPSLAKEDVLMPTPPIRLVTESVQKQERREEGVGDFGVTLSASTEAWLEDLPSPSTLAERALLRALGQIHESELSLVDEKELEEFASLFVEEGGSFDQYIQSLLAALDPSWNQKERNFIYEFGRQARPESSFTASVIRDLKSARQGSRQIAQADDVRLVEILMAQPDLTFQEKASVLQRSQITSPSAN